jgi:hypothetical protein
MAPGFSRCRELTLDLPTHQSYRALIAYWRIQEGLHVRRNRKVRVLVRRLAGKSVLIPAATLLLVALITPATAGAGPSRYTFREVAELGNPAPGGGTFTNDFEPSAINNSGQVPFTADIDTSGDEGVFLASGGQISQLVRAGLPGPSGVTFGPGELGRLGLDSGGDVALGFTLPPFDPSTPGLPGGVFRFSQATNALTGVEIPGTPAPGGGTFEGTYFNLGMNNQGSIVFPGLATGTAVEPPGTPPSYNGMALGLFRQDNSGTATRLVMPGDRAPGGRVFDDAWNGSINSGGDVAFSGHLVGDSCIVIGPPFVCGDSLYLRHAATGAISSIAHQGDPAPGGGTFSTAFGALINNSDQVAFVGSLGSGAGPPCAVFRYQNGVVSAVARPGDPMPGGGHFFSTTCSAQELGINQAGNICFGAQLDTVTNGLPDTGLYCLANGSLRMVARTGTAIPGVGTIAYLGDAVPVSGATPDFRYGGPTNDQGQALVGATMTNGTVALLVASPAS